MATRRATIYALLSEGQRGFEDLRAELQIPVHVLLEDLQHVERSARGRGDRFVLEPARCSACRFTFKTSNAKRFRAPSRCPQCKSERIHDSRFEIEARGGGPR